MDLEVEKIYVVPGADFSVYVRAPGSLPPEWSSDHNWLVVPDEPVRRVSVQVLSSAGPGSKAGLKATIADVGTGESEIEVVNSSQGTLPLPYDPGERPVFPMTCVGNACRAAAGVGAVPNQAIGASTGVVLFSEDYAAQPVTMSRAVPVQVDVVVEGCLDPTLCDQVLEQTKELFRKNRVGGSLVTQPGADDDVSDVAVKCAMYTDVASPLTIVLASEVVDDEASNGTTPRTVRGIYCPSRNRILLDRDSGILNVLAHELAHAFGLADLTDAAAPWNLMWGSHDDTQARARESFTLGQLFWMNRSSTSQLAIANTLFVSDLSCPQGCASITFDLPRK